MVYSRLAEKMHNAESHIINGCFQHILNSKLGSLTRGLNSSPTADIAADSLAKVAMLILKFAT